MNTQKHKRIHMKNKSIVNDFHNTNLAIDLISLGARLPMLESETNLPHSRLKKLHIEVLGYSPPKGLLPYSTEWFMVWESNLHASFFINIYLYLRKLNTSQRLDCIIRSYKLYKEQILLLDKIHPLLGINRAWMLIRFIESGVLELSRCHLCGGMFVTHAYHPANDFVCSLCKPPSRALKKRKTISP